MTIGIAASGACAGAGILAGLRAVEAVGRGAIGGFVSLAVLTKDDRLLRAETQTMGTRGLFGEAPPEALLHAPLAALISSGPDRPTPLSQFVAADPEAGLVTGHRFPHALSAEGRPLNETILEAMRSGADPQQAIDDIVAAEPSHDAGFIALSRAGTIGLGNMPSVLRRSDQGTRLLHDAEMGARVAVIHNAIHPHAAIALLASEVVLDTMRVRTTKQRTISVGEGVGLSYGAAPEIHVDKDLNTIRISHPDARDICDETSFGMGDRVRVMQGGTPIGWLGHEPFMIVKDGLVLTWDGKPSLRLPVLVQD